MLRFYQNSWHRISFEKLGVKLSTENLPDRNFYANFYRVFFTKYRGYTDLEPEWLQLKINTAGDIYKTVAKYVDPSILSIGAGIGIVENELVKLGLKDITINEVSPDVLQFCEMREHLRLETDEFPAFLCSDEKYDVILLNGIEYCFDNESFHHLLDNVKKHLADDGIVIFNSWSYYEAWSFSNFKLLVSFIWHYFSKFLLRNSKSRKQFWGFLRSRKEIIQFFVNSGFSVNELKSGAHFSTKWDTLTLTLRMVVN